jgi:hypothetical protein
MTCPDIECHDNVKTLKESVKCIPKKVGRSELWTGICAALVLLVPVSCAYVNDINKRMIMNEKAIIAIQEQQKKVETTVYQAVRNAIRDSKL